MCRIRIILKYRYYQFLFVRKVDTFRCKKYSICSHIRQYFIFYCHKLLAPSIIKQADLICHAYKCLPKELFYMLRQVCQVHYEALYILGCKAAICRNICQKKKCQKQAIKSLISHISILSPFWGGHPFERVLIPFIFISLTLSVNVHRILL